MSEPIVVTGVAHGGDGIARVDGKAVFVRGAIVGDVVLLRITEERPRFNRAEVGELVEPSPYRISAPCPVFGTCGGCTWQMASHVTQLEWKREVVRSQLNHVGRIETDVLPVTAPSDPYRYRNRIDLRIESGVPAMLASSSHTAVPIDDCLLAEVSLSEFIRSHDWAGASGKVTLRAGVGGVFAMGKGPGLADPRTATTYQKVAGVSFRISGRAFFQVNTLGASELVRLVGMALGEVRPTDVMVDGYAGGGLFAATVGSTAGTVVAVEPDRRAVHDLRQNAPRVSVEGRTIEQSFQRLPARADLVVVDPPRQGLGKAVVAGLVALQPRAIASVSCDPAGFARDARLLVDAGYSLDWVQPVDMFPQTPHIETVARFSR